MIRDGRGARCAIAYTDLGEIALPRAMRKPLIIMHEMAHILTPRKDIAPHGPEFTRAYLDIVRRFLGTAKAIQLWSAFRVYRVKIGENNGV